MRSRNPYRRIAAVLAACVLTIPTAACGSTEKKIELQVSGPANADITYGIGVDQSQVNGAALPWTKELTSKDDPLIAVITAQSKGSEEITCKILIDGEAVKTSKSLGQFAVVTCSNS